MSTGGPCPAAAGGDPGGAAGVSPGGVSMFRWLEVLEKEFDKAFVDVDLLLGEIDPDQADITYEGRQKMTSLSSCFAQLCHKAQTVSQINHKLEVCGSGSRQSWGAGLSGGASQGGPRALEPVTHGEVTRASSVLGSRSVRVREW